MKSQSTIRRHIRELRKFIDTPTSAETSPEAIISKRLAYTVETVLRYETEKTVGWSNPLAEVLKETEILIRDLKRKL